MVEFRFQRPPAQYDPAYFERLMRDLRIALTAIEAVGPETIAGLTLTNYPTSGQDQPPGKVFVDNDGFLRIVFASTGYGVVGGLSLSVGTVSAHSP